MLPYFGSGFGALEQAVLVKGETTPETVTRFLALNNRMTVVCTLLLLASFSCLVLSMI